MMLFKEILDHPTKGPSNSQPKYAAKISGKNCARTIVKRNGGGPRKKSVTLKSKQPGNTAPKPSKGVKQVVKMPTSSKTTTYDVNVPSSTPVFTPIKTEKLSSQGNREPVSISSSQCSLIELLQQYNNKTISNRSQQYSTSSEGEVLERTLTPDLQEVELNPQMHTFEEVLLKLVKLIRSPNSDNNELIVNAFDDVKVAFESLKKESDTEKSVCSNGGRYFTTDKETLSNIASSTNLEHLQNENIALQRQLRLAKNEIKNYERKTQVNDISLEMAALQCQNAVLERKISELTLACEQAMNTQKSISDENTKLTMENHKLQQDLLVKNNELTKSGNIFSLETQQIKQDVGEALVKVEDLKRNLIEANKENLRLSEAVHEKDCEIDRLSELNKGLQSSVSRLLQDLNKPSKPESREVNITSLVLKKFDDILSSPSRTKPVNRPTIMDLSPKRSVEVEKQYHDFFTSPHVNNMSAPQYNPAVTYSTKSVAPAPVVESVPSAMVGSVSSASMPSNGSVSSSMWSVTSRDEKDFNTGLASLDADIQRLQDSLKSLSASK